MLRVAVPNKGALAAGAAEMLREAGYRQRTEGELTCLDVDNDLEFFYLRPRDIATYVASGDLDLGITGRDLMVDASVEVDEVLELGFGGSTFCLAARPGRFGTVADLAGCRIATAYPGLLTRFLEQNSIQATVIRLDGAVENAIGLGVADAIADVVDTGATLRSVGLAPIGDPVLTSVAVLIRGRHNTDNGAVTQLVRRLSGVLVARRYVMLAYDVPEPSLEAAVALTPGFESPTISPLRRPGWVAVQAMVLRSDIHKIMDELYEIGARAILVTGIHACRL